MTPERWAAAKRLFDALLELPPDERRPSLARDCAADPDLRREIEALLEAHENAPEGFLLEPPMAEDDDGTPEDLGAHSILVSLRGQGAGLEGVSLEQLDDETPIEVRAGSAKYQVLGTVGQGGMGKVYAALDRDLKRPVALKMLRASEDGMMEQRFLEEAQVMGQLQHPNILHVYELGLTENKELYYTMPLVKGRTLRTVLDELKRGDAKAKKTWSLTRLVQLLQQVGQAVDYAHAKGVIHRDLKPANVMVGEHGEVQVLDWGLAKVVNEGAVKTDLALSLTGTGHVLGTPAYMSPEQAKGENADGRTDVYAVGVMLYEALTLEMPFAGPTRTILHAVVHEEPVAPRAKAPERSIPLELEGICLKALRKKRDERQQTLGELVTELQTWLESESDRAKRHERAEEKAAEGRAKLAEYFRTKEEVKRLEAEAEEVAKRFEPWQPAEEKAELIAAQDALRAARRALVVTATAVVGKATEALGSEEDNATARELLADYYWDRYLRAEEEFAEDDQTYFSGLVAQYHGGRYERELRGDGSLTLTTDPPGAEVWLYQNVEEGLVLVPRRERLLGTTPLGAIALPMGSYVAVLKKEGYRDVRYPVHITRNREWVGLVRMCTEGESGTGFVFVPGGPCVVGGDEEAFDSWPRKEITVADYFIAEHPVTMGEYLEYVNDVAKREGLEAARGRAPRRAPDDEKSYLLEDGAGGLKLPEVDAEGDRWNARMPALGISWHDAVAYCGWRSSRDGVEYRLASAEEWEKAARGVDGRWYPWGWRFDASLCNMRESRKERPAAVSVEEFPTDVSVYGVRGLGGNIRDWTSSEEMHGTRDTGRVIRVYRGGGWYGPAVNCRAAKRSIGVPALVHDDIGLRLARSRF